MSAPTLAAAESGVDELPRCSPCSSHLCQHWGRDTGRIISATDDAPPLTTTSECQRLCIGDRETDWHGGEGLWGGGLLVTVMLHPLNQGCNKKKQHLNKQELDAVARRSCLFSGPWKALVSPAQTRHLLTERAAGGHADNSLSGCWREWWSAVKKRRQEEGHCHPGAAGR